MNGAEYVAFALGIAAGRLLCRQYLALRRSPRPSSTPVSAEQRARRAALAATTTYHHPDWSSHHADRYRGA
jgi:hypothetical protein